MLVIPTVLFISLFALLYNIFVPREGISYATVTVDKIRHRLMARIKDKGRDKKLTIIGKKPEQVLMESLKASLFLGVMLAVLTFKLFGPYSAIFIALGLVGCIFIAEVTSNQLFKEWQNKLENCISELVDTLPAFTSSGLNTRDALETTVPFLLEPLKSEFGRIVGSLKRKGNSEEVLMELASRSQVPLLESICFRLSQSWDEINDSDMFTDLGEDVLNAKELIASKATSKKNGLLAMFIMFGVLGIIVLAAVPAVMIGKNYFIKMFGG